MDSLGGWQGERAAAGVSVPGPGGALPGQPSPARDVVAAGRPPPRSAVGRSRGRFRMALGAAAAAAAAVHVLPFEGARPVLHQRVALRGAPPRHRPALLATPPLEECVLPPARAARRTLPGPAPTRRPACRAPRLVASGRWRTRRRPVARARGRADVDRRSCPPAAHGLAPRHAAPRSAAPRDRRRRDRCAWRSRTPARLSPAAPPHVPQPPIR